VAKEKAEGDSPRPNNTSLLPSFLMGGSAAHHSQ